ncbi:MAG: 4-aminobutyrate aminotransferase-like enzyme/GNAT superfamily N-acetyltransferase, partial [Bradymonadia bacterium]
GLEDALIQLFEMLLVHDPAAFLKRPERAIHIPQTGEMPRSAQYLDRFYGAGFVPREKKPAVVDLARCQGPFLRSVDAEPLQIIDAASQIASLAAGFRPDAVQAALDEGQFDPFMVGAHAPDSPTAAPVLDAFAAALIEAAPPGMDHVTFVNAGAEANEKAFTLARHRRPGCHRILAFEGSFHGRTLLSLYSTYNPIKRAPYELPGFETTFLPFPVDVEPYADPLIPADWRAAWSDPDGRREWPDDDRMVAPEVAALNAVEAQILAGSALACIVEPYQCEGGDRSASRRFFHGLRALTRAHGMPLIFDEVQSGFGLAGHGVYWGQLFHLLDAEGNPDGPDYIVGAKRAQVGYVISREPDPEPTTTHAASAIRGHAHLRLLQTQPSHAARALERITELAKKWKGIISRPRVFGDAFAFDMPNKAAANHLIGQRFYRGYMVYIAGKRTLRYRLNRGMRPAEVDAIFEVVDRSLTALVEDAGGCGPELADRMSDCKPEPWDTPRPALPAPPAPSLSAILADPTSVTADRALRSLGPIGRADRTRAAEHLGLSNGCTAAEARAAIAAADPEKFWYESGVTAARWAADRIGTRIRAINLAEFDALIDAVQALEAECYEAARQDTVGYFRNIVAAKDAIAFVAENGDGLVGMTFGAPLEMWPDLAGPRQDPLRGRRNTLYSADLTVAPRAQGHGVGARLRVAMMRGALEAKTDTGAPRYAFIAGRNQVGHADAMWRLNQKYGAYQVASYHGQYGAEAGLTRYYRLPLRRHDRRAFETQAEAGMQVEAALEFGDGVIMPTGAAHPLLVRARQLGVFDEPALTKLTVSNFITAGFARYSEYLQRVAPKGNPHLYFTSSPDEMIDKSIRALKHNRKAGRLVIGVEGGWTGGVTAAARTLSGLDGEGHFGWPKIPHPADGDTIAALDALVAEHGADALIGVYIEAIQARTGRALTAEQWDALCTWRSANQVPIVLIESNSGLYRHGGPTFWWSDAQSAPADVVLWWAGGQIGHVFSSAATFVKKPLTLISTWDGDELSAARMLWQMYATHGLDVAKQVAALDAALEGVAHAGQGLYRHVPVADAGRVQTTLAEQGVRVGVLGDHIIVAPPLTASSDEFERFGAAFKDALSR